MAQPNDEVGGVTREVFIGRLSKARRAGCTRGTVVP
jgi:hypothetical protein